MIKTVIFDFDGVIADTLSFTLKKITQLTQKIKIKNLSEENLIEDLRSKKYQELLKEVGWQFFIFRLPQIILAIKKAQEELYFQIDKIKIFPEMKKLFADLKKQGLTIALLSSNLEKNVKKFLEVHKIENVFEKIDCGSQLLRKDKAITNFLKKNGWRQSETVYIGDEIRDVEACKKTGIKIIGVAWGFQKADILQKYGADFIARKPSDILKIINKN